MDTTLLLRAADRLDQHATVVRARTLVIGRQRDTMRWHSPAQRRCATRLDGLCARLMRASGELGALAERLRAHAALVLRGS